eukprot:scaffold5350_cov362-Prasinococcus_capsulatus_cf.AAC.3
MAQMGLRHPPGERAQAANEWTAARGVFLSPSRNTGYFETVYGFIRRGPALARRSAQTAPDRAHPPLVVRGAGAGEREKVSLRNGATRGMSAARGGSSESVLVFAAVAFPPWRRLLTTALTLRIVQQQLIITRDGVDALVPRLCCAKRERENARARAARTTEGPRRQGDGR